MKTAFFLLCIGAGIYELHGYLVQRKAQEEYAAFVASEPRNRPASRSGFIDAVQPDGTSPYVVTVLMPVGCPLEAGRRGRALIDKLKAANIPVTASSTARTTVKAHTKAEFDAKMERVNRVMTGETPVVFFKGRAKNNPTFEDVLAEYQTSR